MLKISKKKRISIPKDSKTDALLNGNVDLFSRHLPNVFHKNKSVLLALLGLEKIKWLA